MATEKVSATLGDCWFVRASGSRSASAKESGSRFWLGRVSGCESWLANETHFATATVSERGECCQLVKENG